MTRLLVVLLCASLVSGSRAAVAQSVSAPDGAAPRAVTLDEALAFARQNAPEIVQAAGQLRNGRAGVRAAWGAFLPGLTVSAGTTRQYSGDAGRTRIENGTVVTLPSTPWSYSSSFGTSLELFAGGQRLFDLRQARATLASARASEVTLRYVVDLDVKQQYFNVLAARESQAAARAQEGQAEQQLKAAVLRVRAARATKSDSLRSEIALRNARLALSQAGADLASAEASLTRAVGMPDRITAAADDGIAAVAAVLGEGELSRLVDDGPAVRQAIAQRDAARAARAAAWTAYLPSVSASYSRGGSGSGTDPVFGADDLSYNGTLRFSLSLPLFNQFAREQQVVQRGVALDNAEAALRDARLTARESLTRYLGVLRTAGERVQLQAESVGAAEEDLRVQQQRYAIGESTLLDLLTSQTQLDDARAALIRARYDQRIARAQIEALAGRDL